MQGGTQGQLGAGDRQFSRERQNPYISYKCALGVAAVAAHCLRRQWASGCSPRGGTAPAAKASARSAQK